MNMFSNFKTEEDGIEAEKDVLGGGYQKLESDVYHAVIKMAYITGNKPNKEGKQTALAVNLELSVSTEGKEPVDYNERIYVSNRDHGNTYTKDGKEYPLPGFSMINSLVALATGTDTLQTTDMEERVVELYNADEQKKVPTEVPALINLIDKEVYVAIAKIETNKQQKGANGYEPTTEIIELNNIQKAFMADTKQTFTEAKEELEPEFMQKWLDKNQGQVISRLARNAVEPNTKATPTATGAKPQAAGKSALFQKKSK